ISAQQAVNLGLIVNELVTNAVKYAFPGNRAGEIHVRYGDLEGECTLQVLDDGIGTPPPAGAMGTGTKLVKALVGQMGGKVDWHYAPGTKVVVFLPNCEG
ncbi:MAG TPA: sensor histidine kinase, partial [Allosphingosinicella sp.]|nr:sensor histidine kinase [Allosphingosinicella sp.]